MNEKTIQILSLAFIAFSAVLITWIYAVAPVSVEDATVKARESINTIGNRTQRAAGIYEIDEEEFRVGLEAFRGERYPLAREYFKRADPESADPRTQYYIAYSFYRQGWGRIANDDELFRRGLEAVERVRKLDPVFRSDDVELGLREPVELKQELEEGLRTTAADFNPLRLVRERK